MRALLIAALILCVAPTQARAAEIACVKYGPCPLDLSSFACTDTPRSSFIRRVCYDASKLFMTIKLQGTWYPYCNVDEATVQNLLTAESAGRYFNQKIRGHGSRRGPFDCRDNPSPSY
jgi:hypothetical protein